MTVSVGTFDDLRGGWPQPIDRNPSIDCADCGSPFSWRDYWKPRITGDVVDPDGDWLCDECRAERERIARRRERNHFLMEFGA